MLFKDFEKEFAKISGTVGRPAKVETKSSITERMENWYERKGGNIKRFLVHPDDYPQVLAFANKTVPPEGYSNKSGVPYFLDLRVDALAAKYSPVQRVKEEILDAIKAV